MLRKKYNKLRKCVIYEIVCNITGERYIGSTNNYSNRKYRHKKDITTKKKCVSSIIILRGNYRFNKLEEITIRFELSLLLKEQYYLDNLENINKKRALTINWIIFRKVQNKWLENNIKKHKSNGKLWYESNKEKLKIKRKLYRNNNKEQIKEKASTKYVCECGKKVRNDSKWRHEKTIIHKKYINRL